MQIQLLNVMGQSKLKISEILQTGHFFFTTVNHSLHIREGLFVTRDESHFDFMSSGDFLNPSFNYHPQMEIQCHFKSQGMELLHLHIHAIFKCF